MTSVTHRGSRQLIVIDDSATRTVQRACLITDALSALADPSHYRSLWLGPGPNGIDTSPQSAAFNHLGREYDTLVFNACEGFDCNAFAAINGTLVAGGHLLLLVPPLSDWPTGPDSERHRVTVWQQETATRQSHYLHRLASHLKMLPVMTFGLFAGARVLPESSSTASPHSATGTGRTQAPAQQSILIERLQCHCLNSTNQTLLLTADRGRGKSAALGIMLARLNYAVMPSAKASRRHRTILCGPNKEAVSVLMTHYHREKTRLAANSTPTMSDAELTFLPPEDVIAQLSTQVRANPRIEKTLAPDLVIIDEAARIPMTLLLSIIEQAPCSVLSTTVAGYEGAGRGFELLLKGILTQRSISFTHESLTDPKRWHADDCLEPFINKLLLLDADITPQPALPAAPVELAEISEIEPAELANSEALLRDVYGLLLQAHYRTTPLDLRHILDGLNLRVWVLRVDDQLLGAALIATEGGIDDIILKQGILARRRRPRGHVIPQLLAQYTHAAEALDLNVARIVRIAIHPGCQRRGLGSHFLEALHQTYCDRGYDATAAMFSAAPDAIRYWQSNHYTPFHTGARPQSSHTYASLCVMRAHSERANALLSCAEQLHTDNEQFLTSQLGLAPSRESHYLDDVIVRHYCNTERNFHDSRAAIARCITRAQVKLTPHDSHPEARREQHHFTQQERQLMTLATVPEHTIASLSAALDFHNRKHCEQSLRHCLRRLTGEQAC